MDWTREVIDALGGAFPDDEVEFLPRATSNGKALGLPYIDARSVMRRLDAAVGPGGWSFDFDMLAPDGKMVRGKLTVLGVTKCDAGEAGSEDEPLKSAVSDALKRAAVHFGIGRYLYYLPRIWAPYDGQKRQFVEPPRLSPQAVAKALAICGIGAPPPPESSGDRAAAAAIPTAAPIPNPVAAARVRGAERAKGMPVAGGGETAICTGPDCNRSLTKGQHDVSLRAFGAPLCPTCQKQRARNAV